MNRSKLGKAAFSAAVALALGFGVQEAVAVAPTTAAARPYCEDTIDCQETCDRMYPDRPTFGVCTSGHSCFCYF